MRKNYFLLVLAGGMFCLSLQAQIGKYGINPFDKPTPMLQLRAAETQRTDSVLIHNLTDGTITKRVYTYENGGLLQKEICYTQKAGDPAEQWNVSYQNETVYDQAGNCLKIERQDWKEGKWVDAYSEEYTYDAQNRTETLIVKNYSANTLQNITHTYDGSTDTSINTMTDLVPGTTTNWSQMKNVISWPSSVERKWEIFYWDGPDGENGEWKMSTLAITKYDSEGRAIEDSAAVVSYAPGFEYKNKWAYEGKNIYYTYLEKTDFKSSPAVDEYGFVLKLEQKTVVEGENPEITTISEIDYTQENPQWVTINQSTTYYNGGVTGISSTPETTAVRVYAYEGNIYVDTPARTSIQVYAITGVCRYNAPAEGSTQIAVPSGLYIVRVGEQAFKIMVK